MAGGLPALWSEVASALSRVDLMRELDTQFAHQVGGGAVGQGYSSALVGPEAELEGRIGQLFNKEEWRMRREKLLVQSLTTSVTTALEAGSGQCGLGALDSAAAVNASNQAMVKDVQSAVFLAGLASSRRCATGSSQAAQLRSSIFYPVAKDLYDLAIKTSPTILKISTSTPKSGEESSAKQHHNNVLDSLNRASGGPGGKFTQRARLAELDAEWRLLFYIHLQNHQFQQKQQPSGSSSGSGGGGGPTSISSLPGQIQSYIASRRDLWREGVSKLRNAVATPVSSPSKNNKSGANDDATHQTTATSRTMTAQSAMERIQQHPNGKKAIIRLQSWWRCRQQRRRYLEQVQNLNQMRQDLLTGPTFGGLVSQHRQQQDTLHQLVQAQHYVENQGDQLEQYDANEETDFDKQWKKWEQGMNDFYLNKCPLDSDWIQQEDTTAKKGVRYLNIRTGKLQEENPNTLKVIATKNRQWLKATKARGERQKAMAEKAKEVDRLARDKIPAFFAALPA